MADADARALLVIAHRDLQAAQGMTDPGAFHEVVWGFQLQQAVEKALKAWLYWLGQSPAFTHDLVALLKLLQRCEVDIHPYRSLGRLTDFAVQWRYDEQPPEQQLDRSAWNAAVVGLVQHVETLLASGR
ncbi:MAG: HEPN domain-containing protein [Synechococcaceae bacterium WBB_3_034]|jgi:HEPN domain-containing protein|nr:HEPN domain-containing protein [Synechococcaceae bacterium WBB_3_034]